MAEIKTIYVSMIEGVKAYVPVEAQQLKDNLFLISDNKLYDAEDYTALFEFIPGDTVSCEVQGKRNFSTDEISTSLVAKSLISSSVPDRNFYMLMFIIADQNGVLNNKQIGFYQTEINELKGRILREGIGNNIFHPNVNRWARSNI